MTTSNCSQGAPSLAHIMSEAQEIMGRLGVLSAEQTMSAVKISDQQIGTSQLYKQSTEKEISDSKSLNIATYVVVAAAAATSVLAGAAGTKGLPVVAQAVKDILAPLTTAGADIAEGVFAEKLGDDQKAQMEYSGSVTLMGTASSDSMDAAADLMQKEQGVLRSLNAMISNQKQAAGG